MSETQLTCRSASGTYAVFNLCLSPPAYLGDAQPDVRVPLRVIEANFDFFGFVGV